MKARMRHRGPDDEGVYIDREAGFALGVTRLSVIDVAGGHQPLANEDATVWAVLNGEIYNHPSLRGHLHRLGHNLATRSDTEVLVHLYEEYGLDLVHALEGMFAFAIWDTHRRRLLLARDRFGEKPVFYTVSGGDISFASELTALCAGTTFVRELDGSSVDSVLRYGYVPGPESIFEGIKQLPPAHHLVWERGGEPTVSRYWDMPSTGVSNGEPVRDLVFETRRLLEKSVQSRMVADVPLGVLLSGGVDSTLVAALAAASSRARVKTFTVGYDVGNVSEVATARRVAGILGAEHHEVVFDVNDVSRRVPAVLASLDQPIADQALVAAHAVAQVARSEVTVAVGGEGADELFAGYPRYRWMLRAEQFSSLIPERARSGIAAAMDLPAAPQQLRRRLGLALRPMTTAERHREWITSGRGPALRLLYGPRLSDAHVVNALFEPDVADGDLIAALMRFDQTRWLADNVLAKADRASMLVSLEVRTPYLNRELAEFAATVPTSVHARGGGKFLLRQVMRSLIPRQSPPRKTAFRVPAGDWLRGPLLPVMMGQLRSGNLVKEGWIDRLALSRMLGEHACGQHDWSGVLWPILTLGLWLDRIRAADAA